MIGCLLRMNAVDHQVTLTWIPEGKRGEGRQGEEEGFKESWEFDE